jgi:hypothetical protein
MKQFGPFPELIGKDAAAVREKASTRKYMDPCHLKVRPIETSGRR